MDPLRAINQMLDELALSIKTLMSRVIDLEALPSTEPLDNIDCLYLQDLSFPKGKRVDGRAAHANLLKHMNEDTKNNSRGKGLLNTC